MNIFNLSFGKDSMATLILAAEQAYEICAEIVKEAEEQK